MMNASNSLSTMRIRSFLIRSVVEPLYGRWVRFISDRLGMGSRVWTRDDREVVRTHWEQRFHERNYFVRDRVAAFAPDAVLEVGSGCGNILFLLAQACPGARFTGIEINPTAVECGNEWIREEGIQSVSLVEGRAEQIGKYPDKSFDVVFSCAAIMYVTPAHITDILMNMLRLARKAVILIEMHDESIADYRGEFRFPRNWIRDYRRILKELNIAPDCIRIEPLPPDIWLPGGGGASLIEVLPG
jgi:SAM-dependent methyltransferase